VMDVRPAARLAAMRERTIDMADLRRCIGSTRFGIEAHDAPIDDFPSQPSQKDGLGRMCKAHWNAYSAGLARDAKARNSAAIDDASGQGDASAPVAAPASVPQPAKRTRRASPVGAGEGDAA
jgi:hypothetical protein